MDVHVVVVDGDDDDIVDVHYVIVIAMCVV